MVLIQKWTECNTNIILVEEQQWYYLILEKGIYIFPYGIDPKVNIMAWLQFELASWGPAGEHFSNYTTRTPPWLIIFIWVSNI